MRDSAGIVVLLLFLLRAVVGSGLVLCVCSDGHADIEVVGNTCCSEDSPPALASEHEHQASGEPCECQDVLFVPGPAVAAASSQSDSTAPLSLAFHPPMALELEPPRVTLTPPPHDPPALGVGHPRSTVVLRL